ncbi:MAG: hypothetical protein GX837_05880 [Methanomicrobiales archaeon]|nr:hypothetical protein [Methanomicrobiales archaeon]
MIATSRKKPSVSAKFCPAHRRGVPLQACRGAPPLAEPEPEVVLDGLPCRRPGVIGDPGQEPDLDGVVKVGRSTECRWTTGLLSCAPICESSSGEESLRAVAMV